MTRAEHAAFGTIVRQLKACAAGERSMVMLTAKVLGTLDRAQILLTAKALGLVISTNGGTCATMPSRAVW